MHRFDYEPAAMKNFSVYPAWLRVIGDALRKRGKKVGANVAGWGVLQVCSSYHFTILSNEHRFDHTTDDDRSELRHICGHRKARPVCFDGLRYERSSLYNRYLDISQSLTVHNRVNQV